ncbi:MAG: energy-coupled thiamine transporter ThiT [Clostridia bacterium]|nr:energy-coupled thiamine transporter ThiT [Clostridia bacterium]MBO4429229.1 energy-coupled thiamine transporter ThiT [Clostridia bacterium]
MNGSNVRRLTTSAVMIAISTAIAVVCEFIPFLNLPFGGTITFASMLPIIIISYMYGTRWGLFTAFTYSVIQIIISVAHGSSGVVIGLFLPDSGFTVATGIAIILLDYVAAYTSLGLGGIFRNIIKNKTGAIVAGGAVALLACYLFHVLSGAIFYGQWAEWFFTDTIVKDLAVSAWIMSTFKGASLAVVYSFIYNGCYMIPEIIITSVAAVALTRIPQIKKEK